MRHCFSAACSEALSNAFAIVSGARDFSPFSKNHQESTHRVNPAVCDWDSAVSYRFRDAIFRAFEGFSRRRSPNILHWGAFMTTLSVQLADTPSSTIFCRFWSHLWLLWERAQRTSGAIPRRRSDSRDIYSYPSHQNVPLDLLSRMPGKSAALWRRQRPFLRPQRCLLTSRIPVRQFSISVTAAVPTLRRSVGCAPLSIASEFRRSTRRLSGSLIPTSASPARSSMPLPVVHHCRTTCITVTLTKAFVPVWFPIISTNLRGPCSWSVAPLSAWFPHVAREATLPGIFFQAATRTARQSPSVTLHTRGF